MSGENKSSPKTIGEVVDFLKEWKIEVMTYATTKSEATELKLKQLEENLDGKITEMIKAVIKKDAITLGLGDNDKAKFSWGKMIKSMVQKNWNNAGLEKEIIDATIAKSANASSLVAGAVLVPTDLSSDIIDLAMPNIAMMDMGVTKYLDLTGELLIPKLTGRPSIYWVDEMEAPTESNVTFGEVKLVPKTAAAFTVISQRLLMQSDGVIEGIVRRELANAFGIGLDAAMITGTGSDKSLLGAMNLPGMTSSANIAMGTNGKRFTVYEAALMAKEIDTANLLRGPAGNFGYLMNPSVKWGMKLEKFPQTTTQDTAGGGAGEWAFNPLISDAALEAMLGFKLRTTTAVPATTTLGSSTTTSSVLFGDFSQIAVGMWGTMEIRASDVAGNANGSALLNRQLWITAFQNIDMQVKNALALISLAGCETKESSWSSQ